MISVDRNTEKLVPVVGRDVVKYLNQFPALQDEVDINNWKNFCSTHPSKELRGTPVDLVTKISRSRSLFSVIDWYDHKVRYVWLLPGFNQTLSRMPREWWASTPNHSNLVETAHVATNYSTGTGLTPLEAIEL